MSLGFIIPPFYIEQNLKLNTLIVGIVNLSAPLGMVIMSQFSNKLTKIQQSIIANFKYITDGNILFSYWSTSI